MSDTSLEGFKLSRPGQSQVAQHLSGAIRAADRICRLRRMSRCAQLGAWKVDGALVGS